MKDCIACHLTERTSITSLFSTLSCVDGTRILICLAPLIKPERTQCIDDHRGAHIRMFKKIASLFEFAAHERILN